MANRTKILDISFACKSINTARKRKKKRKGWGRKKNPGPAACKADILTTTLWKLPLVI